MAAITLDSLGRKIFAALRDSTAIRAECESRFDRLHSVFYGASGGESPGSEVYPVFVIVPWEKDRGDMADRRTFAYSIFLELEDDEVLDDTSGARAFTRDYRLPQSLEVLLDLARGAVEDLADDLELDELLLGLNSMEYFPVGLGELSLTCSFPALIGGFEPTL
jgi:hypothetical protein